MGRRDSVNDTLEVSIWRGGDDGRFQAYRVPRRECPTVLDVVTWVQRNVAPTLAYRFACRVGMCGSCAMTINGRPRWTCRTHVSKVARGGKLRIGPLSNLPVIRDLACDMTPFFEKWQAAKGRFVPAEPGRSGFAPISPASPRRQEIDAAIECINCGVCYAACDVVADNPDYLGPAALNRAWTLVEDERDGGNRERLAAIARAGGCGSCHTNQRCTALCPVGLNPTASIAGLKRTVLGALLRGAL